MSTNLGRYVRSGFIPKIVLDGQQRITSLERVFDKETSRYDRIIFNIFNIVDETFEPYSPRYEPILTLQLTCLPDRRSLRAYPGR